MEPKHHPFEIRKIISQTSSFLFKILISRVYVFPETNSSPLKIGHPKRKLVFQPSIFRCKLLVLGRVTHSTRKNAKPEAVQNLAALRKELDTMKATIKNYRKFMGQKENWVVATEIFFMFTLVSSRFTFLLIILLYF